MASKVRDEVVQMDYLSDLIDYCESPIFTNSIESFKKKHASKFSYLNEAKRSDEDQPLELYETFLEYQALVDGLIKAFGVKHDVDESQLFRNCQEVVEGKFIPLFSEHPNLWFVETLTDWANYDAFSRMMAQEAARGSRK